MELIKITRSRKTASGKNWVYYGLFKCPYCGNVIETDRSSGKNQQSCGCMTKKLISNKTTKHGWYGTRLYKIWAMMRERCNKKYNKSWNRYGGRGISVCKQWDNFINFKDWALENGYNKDLQIDRIDSDGNYSPYNCRWVPQIVNARNKKGLRLNIEIVRAIRLAKGEGVSPSEIQHDFNLPERYVYKIINNEIWRDI